MARECVTHHNACDCREEYFRGLEARLDSARNALQRGYYHHADCVYCFDEPAFKDLYDTLNAAVVETRGTCPAAASEKRETISITHHTYVPPRGTCPYFVIGIPGSLMACRLKEGHTGEHDLECPVPLTE